MSTDPGDIVHAGFLRRWAALFLDQLILTGALYFLVFVAMLVAGASTGFAFDRGDEPPPWLVAGYVAAMGLYYVAAGLYYSLMESSAAQATVGKMALGIKVVDLHGQRLSWPHAIARWFAAALSYLTFYLGFLAAAFTERKQALHDLVAKTLVVDKWAYTDTPERQQRGLSGCLIVFLVFMGLMLMVGVLGILAAIAIPAYQDYVVKARAAAAANAVQPALRAMEASGNCVQEGSDEARRLAGAAGKLIGSMEFSQLENGACEVTVWLPATGGGGSSSDYLSLQSGLGGEAWTCVTNLPERQRPGLCR